MTFIFATSRSSPGGWHAALIAKLLLPTSGIPGFSGSCMTVTNAISMMMVTHIPQSMANGLYPMAVSVPDELVAWMYSSGSVIGIPAGVFIDRLTRNADCEINQ